MTIGMNDLVERLATSCVALRENSVYTADGQCVRLGVQADEMEEAAICIADLTHQLRMAQLAHAEAEVQCAYEVNRPRELLAAWMMANSYATGHGDTVEDLLGELDWQHKTRQSDLLACLQEIIALDFGVPGLGLDIAKALAQDAIDGVSR